MPEKHPTESEILEHLRSHQLFKSLQDKTLNHLQQHIELVPLPAGQVLFTQGEQGDAMFTIFSGTLGIYLKDRDDGTDQGIAQLEAGEIVGEISFLTGAVRVATVKATTDSILINITHTALKETSAKDPTILNTITNTIRERLHKNQMLGVLPDLFGPLPDKALDAFVTNATWLHLDRGEILCKQGEPSDSLYILASGRLRAVVKNPEGDTLNVGEIGVGESVGEMGILTGDVRTASIYALRDSSLLSFSSDFFTEISNQYPDLLRQIAKNVVHRLRMVQEGRQNQVATQLAVFPLSPGLDSFGEQLVEAIRKLGNSVLFLNRNRFNALVNLPNAAQLTLDDPSSIRLQAWLDEQEKRYDYVVYQADLDSTNWGARINQQADQIIFVANSADDPKIRPVEKMLKSDVKTTEEIPESLVLLHRKSFSRPSGTSGWLTLRNIQDHFHVGTDSDGDMARLARHFTGRAVGVVLSGGGARGFAHIGVLRALEEFNVPIDAVCGVSAGALVAGLYGMGLTYEQIFQNFEKLTKNPVDITLPLVSLIRGRKIGRRMQAMFGNTQIEDLLTPVYCVSSNISRATLLVHKIGNLWEAVLASNTPVGISPPVVHNGDLLMDGSALDNMPADVMAAITNGGPVIAVDVNSASDLSAYPSYGKNGLSGWRVLWSRLNPFVDKITFPDPLSLIRRSQELSSIAQGRQFKEELVDLFIAPPVVHFDILGYENGRELEQIGYEYTKNRIEELRDELPHILPRSL